MNRNTLLDALGEVDDLYIISVLEKTDGSSRQTDIHRHVSFRRILVGAAAFVLLLIGSFTAAMAASPDFRDAVFHFFRISTPNTVLPEEDEPQASDSIELIGEETVEETVNVRYIRGSGIFDYSDGVIYMYGESGDPAEAYAIENGSLSPLKPHSEEPEYIWGDMTYSICFDWYQDNSGIHTAAKAYDPASYTSWTATAVKDNTDFLILTLSRGAQIEYEQYPLLYDLNTHQLRDVLGKCEELKSRHITETKFSPDLSKILVFCDFGRSIYCYDINQDALLPLNELSGTEVTGAWFIDNDTLCCISTEDNQMNSCRTVAISSGECSEIFSDLPGLRQSSDTGIIFTGSRYGLFVDEERNTYVYDLKTGDRTIIENFKYPDGGSYTTIMNPANTKMLFVRFDTGTEGRGYSEIGVLDLEARSFILFEREGYETRQEHSIGWFDNDRVVIYAGSEESWYLYLFTITAENTD